MTFLVFDYKTQKLRPFVDIFKQIILLIFNKYLIGKGDIKYWHLVIMFASYVLNILENDCEYAESSLTKLFFLRSITSKEYNKIGKQNDLINEQATIGEDLTPILPNNPLTALKNFCLAT